MCAAKQRIRINGTGRMTHYETAKTRRRKVGGDQVLQALVRDAQETGTPQEQEMPRRNEERRPRRGAPPPLCIKNCYGQNPNVER